MAPSETALAEESRVLGLKPVLAPVHRRYGPGKSQVYDLWPAEDPDAPVVILLHGGYWRYNRMHLTPFAAYLAELGFTTALPEFSRSGGPGGWQAPFTDVALAIDTIGADVRPVIAGHCSGGHLALWAGARSLLPPGSPWHSTVAPRGILGIAPITDIAATIRDDLSDGAAVELMGDEPGLADRLGLTDPVTILRDHGTTGVPTVVLHGTDDAEVPHTQFSDYASVHRDSRSVILDGTGHYTLIEPGAAGARAVADTITALFGTGREVRV